MTAVEFLESKIFGDEIFSLSKVIEQAKEMEKQQIIDAFHKQTQKFYCNEEAEDFAKTKYGPTIYGLERVNAFKEGTKWQQERSYSEEEVKNLLNKRLLSVGIFSSDEATNIWFKQYTKTI